MDALMVGCAVAMSYGKLSFQWKFAMPAAVFLFSLSPWLTIRFQGYYLLTFGFSLNNLAIAYLLLHVVRNPEGALGRVLNQRAVVHIGVISYSLYLQQLFLGKWAFPWSVMGALIAAELSWRFVEKPALGLRDRVMESPKLAAAA